MGDPGLIPGFGRSLGEGNSYTLQYSGLENSMDRGAWKFTVREVKKGWILLSNFTFTLFIIAKSWKQSYSSVGKWINCGPSRQWNTIQC